MANYSGLLVRILVRILSIAPPLPPPPPHPGQLQPEQDAKYLFDLVFENSEMGRIHFGCRDDAERQSWIEWMVRGTGQSLPTQQQGVQEVVRGQWKVLEIAVLNIDLKIVF